METIMKIKDDVNFWTTLEDPLLSGNSIKYFYGIKKEPANHILELEDIDFQNAIELSRKHKKYNLKAEYERKFRCWKDNIYTDGIEPISFLYYFIHSISNTRRNEELSHKIRNEVNEVFKEHRQLLDSIKRASDFFLSYRKTENRYFELEKEWEHNVEIMKKLNALKEQGISAQDFRWDLVEEPEADEE
jgi:hypothetical protein